MVRYLLFLLITIGSSHSLNGQFDSLKQVSGTNLFLAPPMSFEPSENFKGFQNPENPYSMIMVVEMPGPYSEISKGFSEEMMASRGMELSIKQKFDVADYEGVYIELDQEANGFVFAKSILVFGDETKTTIVNGTCLKEEPELFNAIKGSVKSTLIDTTIIVDPRLDLDFDIDESEGNLEFVAVIGNGLLLNRDALIPTESEDQLNIIIDKSFAKVDVEDRDAFCRERLSQYPDDYEVDEAKGITDIVLGDLEGKALFATKDSTNKELMYQVILFLEEGGYYILNAVYIETSIDTFEDIQKVMQTFKMK